MQPKLDEKKLKRLIKQVKIRGKGIYKNCASDTP